jgi:geranylgeranyl diphosphate synthase type 3
MPPSQPSSSSLENVFANADPEQIAMMAEEVILVDRQDKVLGHASKKETHLNVNIEKLDLLHRAFSVFMFNSEGKLLMQKRASSKITFPANWANTCCSHPLFVESELEKGEPQGRHVPCEGVKTAARRKLQQELGIDPDDVPMECFEFVTRVYYKATSDAIWGEHEVDYILVCRPPKDVVVRPNPNEVAEIRWFDMHELRDFVVNSKDNGDIVSPWFHVIWSNVLSQMWTSVLKNESPTTNVDPSKIYEGSTIELNLPAPLSDHLNPVLGKTPRHEVDESVLGPFTYYCETPGKNVRGMMIDAFQAWLKIAPSEVETIKDIVSTLHNASLLVDDIEDNSKLRRGNPTAHLIFGIPATINTANYVYFIAMDKCLRLGNPAAMNVFIAELLNLHRGQGQEINWREHLKCPSESEYTQMVQDKTGGLFRLAVGLMQAFSDCKVDFAPLLNKLALYFQMRDDFLNLADASYMKSKSFCEDLTEGKFSFPIIRAINANPNDNRLLSILKQRTEDIDVKKYAVRLMNEKGALHYTLQVYIVPYAFALEVSRNARSHFPSLVFS